MQTKRPYLVKVEMYGKTYWAKGAITEGWELTDFPNRLSFSEAVRASSFLSQMNLQVERIIVN